MKTTALLLSSAALLLGLSACDQAKDAATKAQSAALSAAEAAKSAAANLAADAKSTAAGTTQSAQDTAAKATEAAAALGADALDKGKELAASALDWTTQKLGTPGADSVLADFKKLFTEAQSAVQGGLTSDKALELKAKWDALSAQASETLKGLTPEQKEKLSGLLDFMKSKWDALLAPAASAPADPAPAAPASK